MKTDMYRIFFPIGWMIGIWGVLVWGLYYFNLIQSPGALHPQIMMGGFILSFVLGFLGTAAPKFTASFPPTQKEMQTAFALGALLLVSQLFENELFFRFSSLGIFIFLIFFLVQRFKKRSANPPAPFLFVAVGVLTGTVGSILLILARLDLVPDSFHSLGRLFFNQAYILSFVLGIGSRLIPSLLGFAPPPNIPQKEISLKTYASLATLFLSTYLIEVFISKYAGVILRALIILFIAIVPWKLYQLPKRKAVQAYGLWLSCLFMVTGYIAASFSTIYYIHLMHLFYISGLSLMTIMIASRVSLSHGGHGVQEEFNSRPLIGLTGAFILAALMRVCAGIFPVYYLSHIMYAAILWIAGMLLWGAVFLPKIIRIKES